MERDTDTHTTTDITELRSYDGIELGDIRFAPYPGSSKTWVGSGSYGTGTILSRTTHTSTIPEVAVADNEGDEQQRQECEARPAES